MGKDKHNGVDGHQLEQESGHEPTWAPLAEHDGAPLLDTHGPVWTLQLNRPAQHNRLDPRDVDALISLFQGSLANGQATALVITGNEAKSFSSGYTLNAITGELDDRFEVMLDALESLPCLTIAAINGNVYGGATDLALCCDIRIGQHGTQMFMPAARIGLHYYPSGLRRYVSRLGLGAASKLMLTGVTIKAPEMLRIGFLTDLVEPQEMTATVAHYSAAAIASEPTVVAQMKQHMQQIANTLAVRDNSTLTALVDSMRNAYHDSVRSPELTRRLAQMSKKK